MLRRFLHPRRWAGPVGFVLACTLIGGALGAATSPEREPDERPRVEVLLDELAATSSPSEARRLERQILAAWNRNDSDTVNLLMEWAAVAMRERQNERALRYLDKVVRIAPDYAEGWNRRATLHYLLDDYGQSLADIGHVLSLQPRHFNALHGLGMVLDEIDRENDALEAFRKALEINPFLEGAEDRIRKLTRKVEGLPI